jgi:hypothetical protein
MDSSEPEAHSFVIKLWIEEPREGGGVAVWRGHVTHVPSGERRYLKELADILDFIDPYLGGASAPHGRRRGLWGRLKRFGTRHRPRGVLP